MTVMRGSSTPSVNQVLTTNSQSSSIFALSCEMLAVPSSWRKSECAEPWK